MSVGLQSRVELTPWERPIGLMEDPRREPAQVARGAAEALRLFQAAQQANSDQDLMRRLLLWLWEAGRLMDQVIDGPRQRAPKRVVRENLALLEEICEALDVTPQHLQVEPHYVQPRHPRRRPNTSYYPAGSGRA